MHKFIVNNRIRSDPLLLPQPSSNNGATTNNMNAVLKLKMALSAHPPPQTSHLVDVGGGSDTNNNNRSSRTSSSASSSDCTHSSSSSTHNSREAGNREMRPAREEKKDSTEKGSDSNGSPNTIRMSGYLKKKRNRVGGWRKLWFVLQNQLLVSYSSKEDYEKRLAPFKDLINLVPGTLIKPAAGARFTIETTANVVYTFRCDNNKVCSEWITAICECLGIKSRRKSIPSLTSQKWTLNRQTNKRVPKLPMAKNTARILQKGLIYEPIDHIAKVQQDFRLHQADIVLGCHQSNDVSRINRMFVVQQQQQPSRNSTESERTVSHRSNSNGGGALKGRPIILSRKMETLPECDDDIEEQMQCITLEDISLLSIPQEDSIEELVASASPVTDFKQIAMLSGDNSATAAVLYKSSSSSGEPNGEPIYAVIDLKEKYQRRAKLNKQAVEQMPVNGHGETAVAVAPTTTNMNGRPPSIEIGPSVNSVFRVDANIVGESAPPPQMLMMMLMKDSARDRNNNQHSNNNNDNVDTVDATIPKESSKIRSGGERPKSFQLYRGSADYEEIHHFSDMKFSEPNSSAEDETEENIYEPINIPEDVLTRGHKNLWSYFPKINFDAILEMGRRRHHQPLLYPTHNSSSNTNNNNGTGTPSPQITPTDLEHPLPSGSSSVSSSSSSSGSFLGMRKKLGTHRKSIKNRMKRMYTRSQPTATTTYQLDTPPPLPLQPPPSRDQQTNQLSTCKSANNSVDNDRIHLSGRLSPAAAADADLGNYKSASPSPPPLPSVNLPKRERNLFTSLSRLRKTRTAIAAACEEVVVVGSKQKRLFVIPDSSPAAAAEEKSSRNVCHSTFYDND